MTARSSTGPGSGPPTFETLDLAVEAPIATVSLDRPAKANAMDPTMWTELQRCFEYLDTEPSVRAVVLRGNGRHFCAGIDLAMFDALGGDGEPGRRAERLRRKILELQDNLSAIERLSKPVLAAVHSVCFGGGLDMASCCDLRFATRDARFAIKEIDVGLMADVGSLQRLPHLIPGGLVRELALTGRELGAEEAYAVRLVNGLYEDETALREGVRGVALEIAAKAPLAVRGTKAALNYARDHSVADALDQAATWNAGMLSFADVAEAMRPAGAGPPRFED